MSETYFGEILIWQNRIGTFVTWSISRDLSDEIGSLTEFAFLTSGNGSAIALGLIETLTSKQRPWVEEMEIGCASSSQYF